MIVGVAIGADVITGVEVITGVPAIIGEAVVRMKAGGPPIPGNFGARATRLME